MPEFNEYRPLYLVTFRAEYPLFGLHATPYHAINLAVHLGCVVLFWMLALLFAAVLLLVLTSRPGSVVFRIFTHPTLSFLGRYSYAIYVFHLLVAFEVAAQFFRSDAVRTVVGSQIPMNIIVSLVCTAVSVTAAWLSWHLFEKQVLKLKRFVPYGRGPGIEPISRQTIKANRALMMASDTRALD